MRFLLSNKIVWALDYFINANDLIFQFPEQILNISIIRLNFWVNSKMPKNTSTQIIPGSSTSKTIQIRLNLDFLKKNFFDQVPRKELRITKSVRNNHTTRTSGETFPQNVV